TRHDRCGGEVRWRDHPIAARERAGPIAAQARIRHIEQCGDEQHRDPPRRHAGDPGATDALRVHDIDVLVGDQTSQNACASPELKRIDRAIHEWSPFAAKGRESPHERPLLACHKGAGARLYQRRSHVERGAGDRPLAQGRHDLQDGRVRQGVQGRRAIVVAHGGQFPRPASACLPLGHPCIQWRHAAKHARRKRAPKTWFPQMSDLCLKFLNVGTAIAARRIAVRRREGAGPGLFWLGGFKSDMKGTKAEALDLWARDNGRAITRFDYSGHGESGGNFTDGTIGRWFEETLAVFDAFCSGPQVVIGSSMGGWLALLLTRELIRRTQPGPSVVRLVLIAPAVDFTEELMWKRFPPEVK